MAKFFGNLNQVLGAAVLALIVVMFLLHSSAIAESGYGTGFFVFLHVLSGIMWIGLLYYFNFVQIPTMPKVPAELKPAVSKFIAPSALYWFRYAALATVATGLIVALLKGYLFAALTFQPGVRAIGLGMWLALIMAYNVWMVIWPNQKIALGIVDGTPEAKAKAATTAMMFSRTNTLLSIPMLYCMVSQNIIQAA